MIAKPTCLECGQLFGEEKEVPGIRYVGLCSPRCLEAAQRRWCECKECKAKRKAKDPAFMPRRRAL